MQTLRTTHGFLLFPSQKPTKTLVKPYKLDSPNCAFDLSWRLRFLTVTRPFLSSFTVKSFSSDEFPVDDTFLENYGPKEKESEDEARRRNWIERGWAPWEEILSPEADFARKSLNEGEEVPLQSPEAIEAFKMLTPKYRKKLMEESGLTEDEYLAKQFEIKGEIPEPLQTTWAGPLVFRHVPPRDWPPRGWKVDEKELEFIREAHKLQAERVNLDELESPRKNTDDLCLERYKVFLKQYKEWVAANKDRLEEDSYKFDQDYHPGRRKRGKDYKEDMLELPFFYPGQICAGKVTTLHLYQGAFVDIGGVYDGWVPIKGNDWYWIRHHIKVGMHVIVEILAKRDPYRFRFPIEMRFVNPNIDHLIFNRFEFPPIFHRDEDTNPDELRRDCGRPPIPMKRKQTKIAEEPLLSNHPYVDKLWQLHVAEQMILDDEEANPYKYKDGKFTESTLDSEFNEEDSIEYTQAYYKKTLLPKMILKTNVKELDLDAARAERELNNKLKREAKERGEEYKVTKMRRNIEMDEYDLIHWRRSLEEREALIRDISCRQALGLPLEEPGRYVDDSYFGTDRYDPSSALYRFDYWGEPKNSEKSKQERLTDAHNKSIIGKGTVWYEMSYEDAIKQQKHGEHSKGLKEKEADKQETKEDQNSVDDDDDCNDEDEDEDEDDFLYSILAESSEDSSEQPLVNGTESSRLSDEGMFEN
ncbi:protein PLASTID TRANSCRIPTIONALLY ACTIVE 10 [Telopea speciosissima]|uniref:protein PLASTID TRANSCRIPTIONALLY ACTIVE 10 n=1 Tax=Telopea speciosissima TaxID=54955 RepID=UPI001CC56BA6|nr:protein PLASTID TRANSCRIPTIONALLY ACTIVE 10 [Telopea speciosissima]